MIGVISRVTEAGVFVEKVKEYPGQELGPIQAVVHRYLDADGDPQLTTYQQGDRVQVVEDSLNDFIVTGIAIGGA